MFKSRQKGSRNLLACRACLATNCNLYNIFDNKLSEYFGRFIGMPVLPTDGYPQHLCSLCTALTKKFIAYTMRCRKTQEVLEETELTGTPLTTCNIRKIKLKKHTCLQYTKKELFNMSIIPPAKGNNNETDHLDINQEVDINEVNDFDDFFNDNTDLVSSEIKDVKSVQLHSTDEIMKKMDNSVHTDINKVEIINIEAKPVFIPVNSINTINQSELTSLNPTNTVINLDKIFTPTIDLTDDNKIQTTTCSNKTNDINSVFIPVNSINTINQPVLTSLNSINTVNNNNDKIVTPTIDLTDDNKIQTTIPRSNKNKIKKRNINITDRIKRLKEKYNFDVVVYSTQEQLDDVKTLKSTSKFKIQCNDCGQGFLDEAKLQNHNKSTHDVALGGFVCTICKARFPKAPYLSKHKNNKHRFKFNCRTCDFSTRSQQTMRLHHSFHSGKTYTCHCGKIFNHHTTYLSHLRLIHTSELIYCEYCGESFIGKSGLNVHRKRMHSDIGSTKFGCPKCNVDFVSFDALAKHQGLVCGEYDCVNCGDGFPTEKILRYHLVQYHNSSGKLYKCGCGADFYNDAALQRHVGDDCGEVVPCAQCGAGFATEELMKEHLYTHSTEEFICQTCQKSYKTAYAYALHFSKQHSDISNKTITPKRRGRKKKKLSTIEDWRDRNLKVMCELCGKMFKNALTYDQHYKIHTGEKPYECKVCLKRFRWALSLQGHIRVHTDERPHECSECDKKFRTYTALYRHKLVHSGARPHTCHLCHKTFQTTTSVKTHVKTVHMKVPTAPRIRKWRLEKRLTDIDDNISN